LGWNNPMALPNVSPSNISMNRGARLSLE
jgi:hypothetical protein